MPSEIESKNDLPKSEPALYVGVWVTKDGYIPRELLPNSRCDEARGHKQSPYRGHYTLSGNHIDHADDTGFTSDGDFRGGVLYHGGMVLYLEEQP